MRVEHPGLPCRRCRVGTGTGSAPGLGRKAACGNTTQHSERARRTPARPASGGTGDGAARVSGESHHPGGPHAHSTTRLRPQIRRDDPLNLSILLSGGKETNKDSLSSGERRGKSPAPNPRPPRARDMWRIGDGCRPGVDRGPESF